LAKAKKIYELAKELGVKSKAIVEKCQAEEIPGVSSHMSPVKLGLEMTIREWFSEEAEAATAVEPADKVDLERVRRPARSGKAKKKEKTEDAPEPAGGTATETAPGAEAGAGEPSAEAPAAPAPAEGEAGDSEAQGSAPPEAAAQSGSEAEEAAKTAGREAAEAVSRRSSRKGEEGKPDQPAGPRGQVNVPSRPEKVEQVGEALDKPQEAKLKGPKVIRVEQAEQVPSPQRSRRPAAPISDGSVPGINRSAGPARGRGVGGAEPEDDRRKGKGKGRRSRTSRRGRTGEALPTGPTKLTEADMLELDAKLKGATGFIKKHRRDMSRRDSGQQAQSALVTGGKVEIAEPITIKDLSAATGIKSSDILKYLFQKGVMANINAAIEAEMATEIAMEYDIELVVKQRQTAAEQVEEEFEAREAVREAPRAPVVAVLGHVDHGKTSLLDRIREEDVAAGEAGGITQHIGAYRVEVEAEEGQRRRVVFLDTPGHQAFTSMRSRGAQLTDIVVLVVAADDGVMPQTVESIRHAQAAEVPIVVALNKIDRPDATEENIQKIYGQLAEHGLHPVEWGGETEVVKVSATEGTGVGELVEVLDYQAQLLELTADQEGPARGRVIETEMQEGRGPVARVLVQQGQLRVGDFIVIGRGFGRVRDMTDDRGQQIQEAGPATPLELSGIDQVPDAGDKFYVTQTLKKAEDVALHFRETEREQQLASRNKVTLDNLADQLKAGDLRELRVVLKADVQGSIDVLRESLSELGTEEVAVRVLHAAVGAITESDVLLADASDAVVIGFHVVAPAAVRDLAETRDVEIRLYRVIYDLTDDVRRGLEGMLDPESREERVGAAEVREVFQVSKVGTVAGCLVTEGSVERTAKVRVIRDGVVVTDEREMGGLRRVKDDVKEVRAGTECGIRIAGFNDVKPGDQIECYRTVEVKRLLD